MIRRVAVTALALPLAIAGGMLAWGELAPHEVSSTIEISASADEVYGIVTDFDGFPQWNPFIVRAEGAPKEGARLHNVLRDSGGGTMAFAPKVLKAEPGRELRWIGRLWMPGIVDGEHYFRIEPAGNGRVRLIQGERFSGALVPVAGGQLDMEDEFAAMNAAVKARAEAA
ncbi:SRPBCC domain-containing protein [Actinomadura soli]|uniref:SRPBCC domain-containing protein n=1 Tax=Actinomadura soli TaxID=2508997 RepID=A0A5C4JJ14_9ACTN|nr:SRPBCC domain-containing protein [Actinomadura soli]TMR06775.1 SRPBCC domain-containing protein [Actinomadura soli]